MKESGADGFQVKSIARERFVNRLGTLSSALMGEIACTVALCVGFDPN
jgi:mRNA-degrading endonuclease toxin of MazEF toxin-antitoxin module